MINQDMENRLFSRGYLRLASLDEAGRGPLAGPVVAGLVIMSSDISHNQEDPNIQAIADSKKLTPKKREELFQFICDNFPVAVGICDNKTIDRINIRQATFLAMKKALGKIKTKPDFLLLDGNALLPNCSYEQQCIKHGDALVFSIAAASIIAKVTRDKIMREIHKQYPNYGFDRHKGYGTKLHLENVAQYGPTPEHRFSFRPISEYSN